MRPWRVGNQHYKQIFSRICTCLRLGVACLKRESEKLMTKIFLWRECLLKTESGFSVNTAFRFRPERKLIAKLRMLAVQQVLAYHR